MIRSRDELAIFTDSAVWRPSAVWCLLTTFMYLWGSFSKMARKSSMIGLESYALPHFKDVLVASLLRRRLLYKRVLCEYRLMGQMSQIEKSDFLKIRSFGHMCIFWENKSPQAVRHPSLDVS